MPDFDMPKDGDWETRAGWVVRQLAADLEWPLTSAAAVVGNFGVESIEFTAFQEISPRSGRGGVSWAQWTGARRRNFEKWCAASGLDQTSDEAGYGFTVFEFRGADRTMEAGSNHKALGDRLRRMTSLEDATKLVHEWYERPQEVLDGTFRSGPKRLEYARRALAGARAPPAPVTAVDVLDDIKAIQAILARSGRYTAAIDGLFGPRSRNALGDLLAAAGQPRV